MAFKEPGPIVSKLKRNKKIPDWDLYDTDEEAMSAAEDMMLENIDVTPFDDSFSFGDVVKHARKLYPYIKEDRIRTLLSDGDEGHPDWIPPTDDEKWNAYRDRMWEYWDKH